jgi:hypothetical protein
MLIGQLAPEDDCELDTIGKRHENNCDNPPRVDSIAFPNVHTCGKGSLINKRIPTLLSTGTRIAMHTEWNWEITRRGTWGTRHKHPLLGV